MAESCDVVIVGAGLAGLICARDLLDKGFEVIVLEAQDAVGGRVRTDEVDGMLLDRGFQLLNPSYPRARADLDLDELDLRCFDAGVTVAREGGSSVLADPFRSPRDAWATATTGLGTLTQRLRLAAWFVEVGFGPARRIKRGPDRSLADELHRRGLDGDLVEVVLRPFLSGTLADAQLATSARFAELIVRSFVRGTPGVPARGMRAIPEQLASTLTPAALRLNQRVSEVSEGGERVTARSEGHEIHARCAVLAAGPVAAARLLERPAPRTRGLSTYYHRAAASPATRKLLYVDGDRRGPVVNTAVMTDVAPAYAPGHALIASTVLGTGDTDAGDGERLVRRQLSAIYDCDTEEWEHVATYAIPDALPDTPPGTALRRSVRAGDRMYECGDHLDTASIQGAMVSGHRASAAVLADHR